MSLNGKPFILSNKAQALAAYPHARQYGGLIFVSGISSRRLDNTYEGVEELADGTLKLDIKKQTRAVINNIKEILEAAGASLAHLIDMQVFLVNMSDYAGFNEVYNEFFDPKTGPSRTTIGVRELPSPKLLIEIKAIAAAPTQQ